MRAYGSLGVGIAHCVSGINMGSTSLHSVVTLSSVLLATGFALAIGLCFGAYPAYRASSLNPIDALHFE